MIKYLTTCILFIFDYFQKKKIVFFLKKIKKNSLNIFFDIGAHKGESINFYSKNLCIKKIYSFEASPINFEIIKKKFKNKENIIIENIALSSEVTKRNFYQCNESSSSTFSEINQNSSYLKKKMKYFNAKNLKNFYKKKIITTNTLDNYLKDKNILYIDFIKIDTEGHELNILKGLNKNINKVGIIMFEHQYSNMLNKKYSFSDIHNFLKKNYFEQIFKIKMPFRKNFEYIYINKR